jgi:two-component system chemotaxis response regulator CheB
MANRDILAIGTSAGGVEALQFLATKLPRDLPASVLVTLHLPSSFDSSLDMILSHAGPLPARFATDGEIMERGRIYIAPPARHLLLYGTEHGKQHGKRHGTRLSLGIGPRENNARPAIDPMLRSVAVCCGPRSIGVVLTGTLGDGAAGLWALKQCGGLAVVQDPEDAAYSEMPLTALRRSNVDRVASLADMPAVLQGLVQEPAGEPAPVPEHFKVELEIARSGLSAMSTMDRIGRRSVLTCPDCGGVTWKIDEGELVHYRCHLGHAYTLDPMSIALDEMVRRALTSGLRALEERVALAQDISTRASRREHTTTAASWAEMASALEREAETMRTSIRRIDAIASSGRVGKKPAP